MRKNILRRLFIGNLLGLTTAVIILMITEVLFSDFFDNFEAKSLDLRYTTKIKKLEESRGGQTIDDIVIIDIDDRSLNKFGRIHQWPRNHYGEIIKYLTDSGALVIGFDIMFMESDTNRNADIQLVHATHQAGNVCHAISFSKAEPDIFLYKMEAPPAELDTSGFSYLFPEEIIKHFSQTDRLDGKFFELYNAAQKLGCVNFLPDNDSVIRKMPLFVNFAGELYPSLAMAMILYLYDVQNSEIEIQPGKFVRLMLPSDKGDESFTIPIDGQGQMLINYMGCYKTFRYISFYDVKEKRVPAEFFSGKYVFIGVSAAGLFDLRPVPFGKPLPGVEIHANMLYSILNQNFIHQTPKFLSCIILIFLCMMISMIVSSFRILINTPINLIISAGFVFSTFFLFNNYNLWIENVRPILGILFCHIAVLTYRYVDESKDKRKIKGMFQHYITATVVNELLKNPGMLKLGGERKVATAFFSDIKDFTTVSESLEPEDLVSVLNEYLSAMTDIILRYEGYLDKYEGDAIVSVFGIPVEHTDHAARACNAALDMRKELVILREIWKREGKPAFEARIGINSGPMIAGNIGGKNRFDYTVIGDSVNIASRLEGANKMYGTTILISENTFQLVHDNFWCRELDFIRVKGKNKPVRIYELIGRKSDEIDPVRSSSLEYFLKGLEIYRKQDWIHAYDMFQKALVLNQQDGPSQEFIRRCKFFIENPRSADWDGVFALKDK